MDPNSSSTFFYLFLAILFLALNAFFVAAEFALVKIRATRVEVLSNQGNKVAKLVSKMIHNMDAYLSATQLGITLASLGLGWIGEPAFADLIEGGLSYFDIEIAPMLLHSISFTIAFSFVSMLHIILGELIPKSIAIQYSEKTFFLLAVPFQFFYLLFYPFLIILNGISNFILSILPLPKLGAIAKAHSEEELKLIVEDSYEEGAIDPSKGLLLGKALDFFYKTIEDIMVKENEIVCVYLDQSVEDNIFQALDSGHTRLPFKTSKEGSISGYIHMKDMIWSLQHKELINLYDLKRPILFFESSLKLDEALKQFQKEKIHIAVVINHHQKQIGLLTLEDIIEELVGEITDEFDRE